MEVFEYFLVLIYLYPKLCQFHLRVALGVLLRCTHGRVQIGTLHEWITPLVIYLATFNGSFFRLSFLTLLILFPHEIIVGL